MITKTASNKFVKTYIETGEIIYNADIIAKYPKLREAIEHKKQYLIICDDVCDALQMTDKAK
jgi:hypothetical protein